MIFLWNIGWLFTFKIPEYSEKKIQKFIQNFPKPFLPHSDFLGSSFPTSGPPGDCISGEAASGTTELVLMEKIHQKNPGPVLVVSTPLNNISQNGFIFPKVRGENQKSLKPPPSGSLEALNSQGRPWSPALTCFFRIGPYVVDGNQKSGEVSPVEVKVVLPILYMYIPGGGPFLKHQQQVSKAPIHFEVNFDPQKISCYIP